MKNLANCTPLEFLVQTNKIRKFVAKWLSDTDIINIRKKLPKLKQIEADMSDDEKSEIIQENKALSAVQAKANINEILDSVLEAHAKETLEVLALCCFIEPEDANNHSLDEYLIAFSDLINKQAVIDFFISLVQLANRDISTTVRT